MICIYIDSCLYGIVFLFFIVFVLSSSNNACSEHEQLLQPHPQPKGNHARIYLNTYMERIFWWRIVCSVSGGDFFLPNHTLAVELISSSLNFMLWLAQIFHPIWWYFVYYDLHMSDWFLYTMLNICIIHIIIWDLSDFPDKIKQKNNANAKIPVWINFNISRQCVVAVIRIRCFRALFSG